MENFAIMTDAGGDFTREIIQKYGIEETPISTIVWPDGTEKPADIYWDTMNPNDYFALMHRKTNQQYCHLFDYSFYYIQKLF